MQFIVIPYMQSQILPEGYSKTRKNNKIILNNNPICHLISVIALLFPWTIFKIHRASGNLSSGRSRFYHYQFVCSMCVASV